MGIVKIFIHNDSFISIQPWWPRLLEHYSSMRALTLISRWRDQIWVLRFVFQILICFISVSDMWKLITKEIPEVALKTTLNGSMF